MLPGSGFDVTIHYQHPGWAGMQIDYLFKEILLPVYHPGLIRDEDPVLQLNNLPLIHRRQNPEAWDNYAQASGIVLDNPAHGPRYDLHEMAITAALAGLGVALVPKMYIEKELREGSLIAPWPDARNVHKTFCLVKPVNSGINQPVLNIFEQ